ncbi:MAG: cupin domain-containing protein [Bacteroidales bacterium]|nr:cupin domain-containing protein [Bacteroidales bacterium]
MVIDYKSAKFEDFPNFKGGEKKLTASMFFDGKCRMFQGVLENGASIGLHRHETSCEMIYVIEGEGNVIIEGKSENVSAGCLHYCPKGAEHTLINSGNNPLKFIAFIAEQ